MKKDRFIYSAFQFNAIHLDYDIGLQQTYAQILYTFWKKMNEQLHSEYYNTFYLLSWIVFSYRLCRAPFVNSYKKSWYSSLLRESNQIPRRITSKWVTKTWHIRRNSLFDYIMLVFPIILYRSSQHSFLGAMESQMMECGIWVKHYAVIRWEK